MSEAATLERQPPAQCTTIGLSVGTWFSRARSWASRTWIAPGVPSSTSPGFADVDERHGAVGEQAVQLGRTVRYSMALSEPTGQSQRRVLFFAGYAISAIWSPMSATMLPVSGETTVE